MQHIHQKWHEPCTALVARCRAKRLGSLNPGVARPLQRDGYRDGTRRRNPMHRLLAIFGLVLVCGLAIGGYAIAQETTSTLDAGLNACATPLASPMAGTPTMTATA